MAFRTLKVVADSRVGEAALSGIVVDEPAFVENIELGASEDADPAATAWAVVEQLEEEQLRLAAELQSERQQVARLKARLRSMELAFARAKRNGRSF